MTRNEAEDIHGLCRCTSGACKCLHGLEVPAQTWRLLQVLSHGLMEFCLQNEDKTRVDKVRYWTAVARLFRESIMCRSESMEEAGSMEAGSGVRDSSHNILTLDALQVLSRSQVTPEVSMRIRPICKSLHTYIHTSSAQVPA
jgi:hypothetical protein